MGRALVPLTYAELVALTGDIPAGPERSRPGGTGQGMVWPRESNAAKADAFTALVASIVVIAAVGSGSANRCKCWSPGPVHARVRARPAPLAARRSRICVGDHAWRAIRSRLCRKGLAPSRLEKPARHAVAASDRPSWGWAFLWLAG